MSAGAATALGAVTVAGAANDDDAGQLLVPVVAGWWIAAAFLGLYLGRRNATSPPIARLLAGARAATSLPEPRPGLILVNRLWPLLLVVVGSIALAFAFPQIPGIAGGFAIVWSLAWRKQDAAVTAIEERDGVQFFIEPTSPLRPMKLVRATGFRRDIVPAGLARDDAGAAVTDVLLVSLGSTAGLRAADDALAASLRRAGASVEVVRADPPPQVRTFALTDLVWARAARAAAQRGLAEHEPRAVLYGAMGAALLWPRPGVIRVDVAMAESRPGRHGAWQRPVERRRLREAPLLVPVTSASLDAAPAQRADAVVVPIPVAPGGAAVPRAVAAVTYAADPVKKGLDRVLAAWAAARRPGEELWVAGLEPRASVEGVVWAGRLEPSAYRALLRSARVFVTAPRREDYGIAQLEALADGCALVTTEAPGPYAALPLARRLDPRLVGDDLAGALRSALDDPAPGYTERAAELLAPFSPEAVDAVVRDALLPRLLS